MADRLHLEPRHRETLEALLRQHLPDAEVWVYGSRVSGKSHDGSDLDLVLRGPSLREIPLCRLEDFDEAVRRSNLPFLVEARDWARLPEHFHREIERDYEVLMQLNSLNTKEAEIHSALFFGRSIDWQIVPLGEIVELTLSSVDKKIKPREERVLLCNYMDVYSQPFIHADLPFMVATASKNEIRRYRLQAGDVIITKDSEQYDDIGVPALVRDVAPNLLCGYHLAILRPLEASIYGFYLYYALQMLGVQRQFHAYANGITRFGLRKDDILRVEIPVPPLPEQRAIAQILGALDDRIELNRRMNETLEAMARALFKSWFVDFDPVRAKMEGCDTGLPRRIADLFPERFVTSELGEIPEGWQYGTIQDITILNPESWSPKHPPKEVTYVDLTNAKWGYIEDTCRFRWEDAPSRARRVLRRGDTIIATVRPANGSFALIDEDGLTGSTGFAVLRPGLSVDRELAWAASTSSENIDRLAHLADGGAYPAVRSDTVGETPVVLANLETREMFSRIAGPLLDKLETNKRISRMMVAIRDTLLPKLVAGKIRTRAMDEPTADKARSATGRTP